MFHFFLRTVSLLTQKNAALSTPTELRIWKQRHRSYHAAAFGHLWQLHPRGQESLHQNLGNLELLRCMKKSTWVFPKIGVKPQNRWFMMENLVKMDDLGVPLFSETSTCGLFSVRFRASNHSRHGASGGPSCNLQFRDIYMSNSRINQLLWVSQNIDIETERVSENCTCQKPASICWLTVPEVFRLSKSTQSRSDVRQQ